MTWISQVIAKTPTQFNLVVGIPLIVGIFTYEVSQSTCISSIVNAYIYCPLRSISTNSRNRKGSGDEANTPPRKSKRSIHGSQDGTPKIYDMENQLSFPSFKKDIIDANGDFDDARTNDTWRDKVSIIIGLSITISLCYRCSTNLSYND